MPSFEKMTFYNRLTENKSKFVNGVMISYDDLVTETKIKDFSFKKNKDNRMVFSVIGENFSRSFDVDYAKIKSYDINKMYHFQIMMNSEFKILARRVN